MSIESRCRPPTILKFFGLLDDTPTCAEKTELLFFIRIGMARVDCTNRLCGCYASFAFAISILVGAIEYDVALAQSSSAPRKASSETGTADSSVTTRPLILDTASKTVPLGSIEGTLTSQSRLLDLLNEDGKSYSETADRLQRGKLCLVGRISESQSVVQTCRTTPLPRIGIWGTFLRQAARSVKLHRAPSASERAIKRVTQKLDRQGEAIFVLEDGDRIIPTSAKKLARYVLRGSDLGAGFPVVLSASCSLSQIALGADIVSPCKGPPVPVPPIGAVLRGDLLKVLRLTSSNSAYSRTILKFRIDSTTKGAPRDVQIPIVIPGSPGSVSKTTGRPGGRTTSPAGKGGAINMLSGNAQPAQGGGQPNQGAGQPREFDSNQDTRGFVDKGRGSVSWRVFGHADSSIPTDVRLGRMDGELRLKLEQLVKSATPTTRPGAETKVLQLMVEATKGDQNSFEQLRTYYPSLTPEALEKFEGLKTVRTTPSDPGFNAEATTKIAEGFWRLLDGELPDGNIHRLWRGAIHLMDQGGTPPKFTISLDPFIGSHDKSGGANVIDINPLQVLVGPGQRSHTPAEALFHEIGYKLDLNSRSNFRGRHSHFVFQTLQTEMFAEELAHKGDLQRAVNNLKTNYSDQMGWVLEFIPETQKMSPIVFQHFIDEVEGKFSYFAPGLTPDKHPPGHYSETFSKMIRRAYTMDIGTWDFNIDPNGIGNVDPLIDEMGELPSQIGGRKADLNHHENEHGMVRALSKMPLESEPAGEIVATNPNLDVSPEIDPSKLQFPFGKATDNPNKKDPTHNTTRSKDMLRNLESVGFHDTPENRARFIELTAESFRTRSPSPPSNRSSGQWYDSEFFIPGEGKWGSGVKVEVDWNENKVISFKVKSGAYPELSVLDSRAVIGWAQPERVSSPFHVTVTTSSGPTSPDTLFRLLGEAEQKVLINDGTPDYISRQRGNGVAYARRVVDGLLEYARQGAPKISKDVNTNRFTATLGNYQTDPYSTEQGALDAANATADAHKRVADAAFAKAGDIIERFGTEGERVDAAEAARQYLQERASTSEPLSEGAREIAKTVHDGLLQDPVVQAATKPMAGSSKVIASTQPTNAGVVLLQQTAQSDRALEARLQDIHSEHVNDVKAATTPDQVAAADKKAVEARNQELSNVIEAHEKAGTKSNLIEGAKNTLKNGGLGALRGADAVGLGILVADIAGGQAIALGEASQALNKAKREATTRQEIAGAEYQFNKDVGDIASGAYLKVGGIALICKVLGNKMVLTHIGRASVYAAAAGAGWLGMDMAAGAGVATYLGGTLSATTFATVGAVVVSSVGLYFTAEALQNPETWSNMAFMASNPRETLNANLYIYSYPFRMLFAQDTLSAYEREQLEQVKAGSSRPLREQWETVKSVPWNVWHQAIQHTLTRSNVTDLVEQQVYGEEMRMDPPDFIHEFVKDYVNDRDGANSNNTQGSGGSGSNAGQVSRGGDRRGGRNNNRIGGPARSTDNRDGDRRGSGRGGNRRGGRNNNAQPGGSASSGGNIPSPQLPNPLQQIPAQQPPSPPDPVGWRPPNPGPISNLPGFAPQQPLPQNPDPVSKPPGSVPQQPQPQNPDPVSKPPGSVPQQPQPQNPDPSSKGYRDSFSAWFDKMARETQASNRKYFKDDWADLPLGEDSKNWIFDEASKEWSPIDCSKWKLNPWTGEWLPSEGAFKVPDGNNASSPPASSGGHTGAVPIKSMGPIRGRPTSERLEASLP